MRNFGSKLNGLNPSESCSPKAPSGAGSSIWSSPGTTSFSIKNRREAPFTTSLCRRGASCQYRRSPNPCAPSIPRGVPRPPVHHRTSRHHLQVTAAAMYVVGPRPPLIYRRLVRSLPMTRDPQHTPWALIGFAQLSVVDTLRDRVVRTC